MDVFNYTVAAELYSGGRRGSRASKQLRYWRFDSVAEALQYAFEVLPGDKLSGAMLEVGDSRFTSDEMRALYADARYPLPRTAPAADGAPTG